MGKIKKSKETTKPDKTEIPKVSNKKTLKPKKITKPKQLEKKLKNGSPKQKVEKVKKGLTPEVEQQFSKAVETLLQYEEKKNDKDLFTREKPIFLQIDVIKIPICPNRRIRIPLKHTLLTDKQEVCLIVPDLKRGRRVDHEPTIEHYEDLLRSKNITTIKRIIPIRQLRVEYDQFELKRRLCGYYDHFLVAGNISGHVNHLLGKIFYVKRKAPIPIKLDAPNLGDIIESSLKKASLHIHPKGSSFVVQFGHSEMTSEQLTDNLQYIAKKLVTDLPGGWLNIRSLHIKTDKSISIPVYYTLKSANTVNVPVIKPIRPKNFEKVTDEVSTKEVGDPKVTVHPGGKVEYKKRQIGQTKNQLRKIRQGQIRKSSTKLRAKQEKLKIKAAKLKAELKAKTMKTELKQEKVETVAKKQKKNKKQKVKLEAAVKQQKIKTESKKQKSPKENNQLQVPNAVQTKKQKKVKKQKKAAEKQNLRKDTTEKVKIKIEKKVISTKKKQKKTVNAAC